MSTPSPAEVVDAYLAAIAAGDFARARTWLSDSGFSTRSPIAAFNDADAYIADISRVGAILERISRRKTFVDGNEVCAIVDYVTHMEQRQVSPVVHLMRVERGKIVGIESFFDARAYAEMFEVS